jgi:hypothetical protein
MELVIQFSFSLSRNVSTDVIVLCDYRFHDPVSTIFRKVDYLHATGI